MTRNHCHHSAFFFFLAGLKTDLSFPPAKVPAAKVKSVREIAWTNHHVLIAYSQSHLSLQQYRHGYLSKPKVNHQQPELQLVKYRHFSGNKKTCIAAGLLYCVIQFFIGV